ncbi:hypothetical protein AB0F07_19735 [Streptomyces fructofermentans]|uniref:hypothetical protein n=1 Tax=Streptomyces fructofermentans TaxID=152141 RepID=UPI0033D58500
MSEPGHAPTPGTDKDRPGGWCHWHEGPSGTALLVGAHERNSGPPFALYACAPCREQRGLIPLA